MPHKPATATATDGPDYLTLPLAWTPTRRLDHSGVAEYRLTLGAGNVAILQLAADKGWAMTIAHGAGRSDTERGLFGTPHDALMVLVAEFVFSGNPLEHSEAEAGADGPSAEMRDSA